MELDLHGGSGLGRRPDRKVGPGGPTLLRPRGHIIGVRWCRVSRGKVTTQDNVGCGCPTSLRRSFGVLRCLVRSIGRQFCSLRCRCRVEHHFCGMRISSNGGYRRMRTPDKIRNSTSRRASLQHSRGRALWIHIELQTHLTATP